MNMTFLLPLILMLGGVGYSAWRIASIMPLSPAWRWAIALLWASMLLLFVLMFALRNNMPIAAIRVLYPLTTSWIFYLLYAVMLFLFIDFLRLIPALRPLLAPSWALTMIVWSVLAGIFVYGSYKYRKKERVALSLPLERKTARPLRIVAISDMHLGYTIGKGELAEWVQLINAEKPDLVLIAGDIVDGDTRPLRDGSVAEELNKLTAPVYASLGNHEYIGAEASERSFLSQTKVQVLQDSVALYEDMLYIVGRDDRSNRYRKPTKDLIKGLDPTKPVILLDHQPYQLEESEQAGIDLQLSGHTHRGQVFPINLIVDRMYERSHGYHHRGTTHYYISSGIGIWGGKYRIGTQSEYVVIDLK